MSEEIVLSIDEHKLLKENASKLEFHFGLKIRLPEVSNYNDFSNDLIVASVSGESQKITLVKAFLQKKMRKLERDRQARCASQDGITVITLSESDSDNAILAETQNKKRRRRGPKKNFSRYCPFAGENSSSMVKETENVEQVSSTTFEPDSEKVSSSSAVEYQHIIDIPKHIPNTNSAQDKDENIVMLSEDIKCQIPNLIDSVKDLPKKNSPDADDSVIILLEDIHQTSNECMPPVSVEEKSTTENADDSIVILSEHVPSCSNRIVTFQSKAEEFIPLRTSAYAVRKKKKGAIIDLSDREIPRPLPKARRILRPVVIDGSNVAREHGKIQNTYSCKGIKICIEYFLKRGHTQVTAFVPQFRRHCRGNVVPTTDQDILEELAKSQNVVFTPSRRVNGKLIMCYDDRFIVELASKNNGVIVSNDNYRDIMEDSPEFKKTIEERLLMFCFVGDIIMIPEDPLGRHGPNLDTFLSMREIETENDTLQSNSLQANNPVLMDQVLKIKFGPFR